MSQAHGVPGAHGALAGRPSLATKALAWLRIAIGIALVAWLLTRADVAELQRISTGAALRGGAIAVVLLLLAQLLSAWRWQTVLGDGAPSLRYLFRLYLVGQFFGLFLPTSVGGDAVRAVSLARATGEGSRAVASILADRLLGVLALGIYLGIGIALWGAGRSGATSIRIDARMLAIAAVAALALAAIGWGVWRFIERRSATVPRIAALRTLGIRSPRTWGALALLALAVQGCYLATWGGLVAALRLPVPPSYLLFAVPAVSLAAMAPFTLSGLGIREGTWMALLVPIGVSPGDALASSLLYFVAFSIVGAFGGIWFSLHGTSPRAGEHGAAAGPSTPSRPGGEEGR